MSLIHLLTPDRFTASTIVCGDPMAATATWKREAVTCPACLQVSLVHSPLSLAKDEGRRTKDNGRSPCTCTVGAPECATCKAWRRTHHTDGSRIPMADRPALKTEKQFQEAIRQAARAAGFLTYHTLTSYGSEPGFPDLVLAKPHHPLFFIEAKMETGRVTPAQQRWMDVLHTITSVEAHVWRPNDLAQALEVLR